MYRSGLCYAICSHACIRMKFIELVTLVLFLGQPSYSGVFVPETYPRVSLNSSALTNCPNTTPLYFGLIMSFDGQQYDGSGAVSGVKVALDRINNDCTLLPGYSLHYTLADSRCNRKAGLDALLKDTIIPGPTKIAVIGSGCSLSTEPTAEVSHYYNITQLSCVSSSSALRDRSRFEKYFQLITSDDTLALAYYGVISEYGWRYVSFIVQDENLFTVTIAKLTNLLKTIGVQYDTRTFTSQQSIDGLGEEPFNLSSRIHIIASYESHARALFCKAHRLGISYPRYLIMFPGWFQREFLALDDTECTPAERESVINMAIAPLNIPFPIRDDPNYTVPDGSISGVEFFEEEKRFLNITPHFLIQSEYAQYCFDAAYTLAYALNNTLKDLQDPLVNRNVAQLYGFGVNESFQLNDSDYSSDALTNIIMKNVENTSFDGITGHVEFDEDGIRILNSFEIFQIRMIPTEDGSAKATYVKFADIMTDTGDIVSFKYVDGESITTVWPNNLIPYDGVPVDREVTVHIALTVFIVVLATAGVVFAVLCTCFNFLFRERKYIKITSPNLNYMIGAGAFILYVDLYLFVIPTTDQLAVSVLCNITPWLTAIGYSLCYGTVVTKMIRVFYIFNNPTPKPKKAVRDWMLALGVLFLVAIDIVILVVFTAVEGSKTDVSGDSEIAAKQVINRENPDDLEGVVQQITRHFIYICDSKARDILLGILYGYKAILQIIALVFSFSIRKVKVRGLNDAKYIAASIYVSSIVLAVVVVSTYTLKDFINAFAAVFCTGFWIGTSVILALSFIPLMISLYKDPKGENMFFKSHKSDSVFTSQHTQGNIDNTEMVVALKRRVSELEDIVSDQAKGEGHYSTEQRLKKIDEQTDAEVMEPIEGTVLENAVTMTAVNTIQCHENHLSEDGGNEED